MNLEELVYEVFPDLIERDDEGEIYTNCPFCEERGETRDTRQRLGVNVIEGKWNCFNCGHSGKENPERLFSELVRIFNLDRTEYKFSWRAYLSRPHAEKKKVEFSAVSLPKEFEPLWEKPTESVQRKALKYVLSRGVTKRQIEDHFIGFCAVGMRAGRLIFPVYRKEKVIGYVARAYEDDLKPKYLNSEGLKYLWNAPDEKKKRGILLEGIFDALAAERCLVKIHPMAGLGASLTDAQIEALLRFNELTIVPDPDKAGFKGVVKRMANLREASSKIKLYVILPEESVDWGKLGETNHGCNRIVRAFHRRIEWTKHVKTRIKAKAAFL